MKVPRPSPKLAPILARMGQARAIEVMTNARGPTVDGRYRHWDNLRHLRPPEGLTSEEWWASLVFSRGSTAEPIGYAGTDGRDFMLSLPREGHRMLHEIDRGASGTLLSSTSGLNPARQEHYLVQSLEEEAIRSSQLEGASTTRRAAKAMLRSGRAPRTTSERMILNNYAAMRWISERRDLDITPERVLALHRIITEGTLDDPADAGRVQQPGEERIVIEDDEGERLHTPPPADQLLVRLSELCDFANGDRDDGFLHPVVRAVLTHFRAGYDHFFVDGNGRTARVLFYWVMLKEGYWLTEYLSVSRILRNAPSQYARSYLYAEDDNDVTYFVLHHLGVTERALRDLRSWLREEADRLQETEALLVDRDLNHRQRALLSHALRHSDAVYTHRGHAVSHGVTGMTASTDLGSLADAKLLTRSTVGRAYEYRVPRDLHDRIASPS